MTTKLPKGKASVERPWLEHYPAGTRDFEILPLSLPTALERAAEKFAGRTALKFYGKNITYAKLLEAADSLAAALIKLGVGPGDRVALYLLNSPQFVIAYLAVLKAGGVVVGVDPNLGVPELARFLEASGVSYLFCHDLLYENVVSSGVVGSGARLEAVIVAGIADYLPVHKRLGCVDIADFSNARITVGND